MTATAAPFSPIAQPKYHFGLGFQYIAVAVALQDPTFLHHYGDVFKPEWFEVEELQVISGLILEHHQQYGRTPTGDEIVAGVNEYARVFGGETREQYQAHLQGQLSQIYGIAIGEQADFVCERMVDFAKRQAVRSALQKGIELLERNDDLDPLRDTLDEALSVGTTRDVGTDVGSVSISLTEHLRASATYDPERKVPMGLPQLDAYMKGGLGAGELMVVAAPPGRGKSTLLVNIGKEASFFFAKQENKKAVIQISLELREADLALMFGAVFTGVLKEEIIAGSERYNKTIPHETLQSALGRVRVKYFSPATQTVSDLQWFIAHLCRTEGIEPGILLLDYADRLKGASGRKGNDAYRGMGAIYDQLIALGDKFEVPVITASQINRDWSYEQVIDMRGLADSWLKNANADVVVTMGRDKIDARHNKLRLYIAKCRRGIGDKTILLEHNGGMAFIRESTADEIKHYDALRKAEMELQKDLDRQSGNNNGGWRGRR